MTGGDRLAMAGLYLAAALATLGGIGATTGEGPSLGQALFVLLLFAALYGVMTAQERRSSETAPESKSKPEPTWLEAAIELDPVIAEVDAEREAALERMRFRVEMAEKAQERKERKEREAAEARERFEAEEQMRVWREERQEEARRQRRERLEAAQAITDPVIRAATYSSLYTTAAEVLELEAARPDQGCAELIAVAQEQQRARALAQLRPHQARYNPKWSFDDSTEDIVRNVLAPRDGAHEVRAFDGTLVKTFYDPGTRHDWCYLCQSGDVLHTTHRDLTNDIREVWAS